MKKLASFLCIFMLLIVLSACTPIHEHKLVYHVAQSATCLEAGNIAYYQCSVCSKMFSDDEGIDEITQIVVPINNKAHIYSSNWSYDDQYHWHSDICGHGTDADVALHNFKNGKCSKCNMPDLKGKSTVLAQPAVATRLTYEERLSENLTAILQSANAFASKLTDATYSVYTKDYNFAISPISVYMALALATECAAGSTRDELLSALGVSYEQLKSDFNLLYRFLIREYTPGDDFRGILDLTNSIWVDESYEVKQPTIEALAEKFYCYSQKTDFVNENKSANQAIQYFVKEQTHGLIDKDFELAPDTVFTLINTIYLKDVWSEFGDLEFTETTHTFNADKSTAKSLRFLQGVYIGGQVHDAETFTHFYTKTFNGYRLKFILPKSGHSIKDVFTQQNIAAINSLNYRDYNANDYENKIHYHTRCVFPEFEASYDDTLTSILRSSFDIKLLFGDCDLSTLSDQPAYCSDVIHATELKVNKTGIEGAAVTVISGDGAMPDDDYQDVYSDYIVDGSFGFILTDIYDTVLFTGVVENV